jgi:hypothetical protein
VESQLVKASIVIAIAMVVSASTLASSYQNSIDSRQTLTVTGSASKALTSDLALLSGTILAGGATRGQAYDELLRSRPILLQYLVQKGFAEQDVVFLPANESQTDEYDRDGRPTGRVLNYSFFQSFQLKSNEVGVIAQLSLDMIALVEKGITVRVDPPQYFYTKLAEEKIGVQALAAGDALERARAISRATGAELGPMRTARMGVLQVTPRNSTLVSDYGVNDTSSIDKEITAVVQANFQISN